MIYKLPHLVRDALGTPAKVSAHSESKQPLTQLSHNAQSVNHNV